MGAVINIGDQIINIPPGGGGGGGGGGFLPPVIDFFDPTGGLPISPSLGHRYIASDTANGWTSQYIYEWSGTLWVETIPVAGNQVLVIALGQVYLFDGVTWGTSVPAPVPGQVIEVSDVFVANDTFNQYPTMSQALARAALIGPSLIKVFPRSTGNYGSFTITDAHAGCVIECHTANLTGDVDFTTVNVNFTLGTYKITVRNARITTVFANNGVTDLVTCSVGTTLPGTSPGLQVGILAPFGASDLDTDVVVLLTNCTVGFAQSGGTAVAVIQCPLNNGSWTNRRQNYIGGVNTTFVTFGGGTIIRGYVDEARFSSASPQFWLYLINCSLAWPALQGTYKIEWPDPVLNDYVTYAGVFQAAIQGTVVEESKIAKPTNLTDLDRMLFLGSKDQAEGITQTAYPPTGRLVGNVQQALVDLHADDQRIEATADSAENGVAVLSTAVDIDSDLTIGQIDGMIVEKFRDLTGVDQAKSKNWQRSSIDNRVQLGRFDVIDDFESYASQAAIRASWVASIGAIFQCDRELTEVFSGSKAMRLSYTGAFTTSYTITRTFGTPKNWDDVHELQLVSWNPSPLVPIQIRLSDGVTVVAQSFRNANVGAWEKQQLIRTGFTVLSGPGPFDWTNVVSMAFSVPSSFTVTLSSFYIVDDIYAVGERPWTQRLNLDPFTINGWTGSGLTTGVSGGNLQLGLSGVDGSALRAFAVNMADDSALGMAVWWSGVSVPGVVDLRLRLTDSVGRKLTTRSGVFLIPTAGWPTLQAKARRLAWTSRDYFNAPNGDVDFSWQNITQVEFLVSNAINVPTGTLNIRLFDSGDAGRLQLIGYQVDPLPRPTQMKMHMAYVAHTQNLLSVDSSFNGITWEWSAPTGLNAQTVIGVGEYDAVLGLDGPYGAIRKLGVWMEDLSPAAWGDIYTRICHFGFMEIEGFSQMFRRIL